MSSTREPDVFAVPSAGRSLRVAAGPRFAERWPLIAPHVPGGVPGALTDAAAGAPADLTLERRVSLSDARRLINAYLHRLHLGHGTLCLHAVALCRPGDGGTVVLLGGHGAGKTLVAIALAEQGWRPVAGDLVLLDTGPAPAFRGGTRAFLARSDALRRWFPYLPTGRPHGGKVDLCGRWDGGGGDAGRGAPVLTAVLVDVDGDPRVHAASPQVADGHTAVTAWLRASTHVLDRILDSSSTVLRLVEDADSARRRVVLIKELAGRVPLHMAWGAPQHVASQVDQLTRAVSSPMEGAAW